jgi:hypothetical protein
MLIRPQVFSWCPFHRSFEYVWQDMSSGSCRQLTVYSGRQIPSTLDRFKIRLEADGHVWDYVYELDDAGHLQVQIIDTHIIVRPPDPADEY